jgi:hypothetical protein
MSALRIVHALNHGKSQDAHPFPGGAILVYTVKSGRICFNGVMRGWRYFYLTGMALACCSALPAVTYEVAQRNLQASDEGPGTVERPLKTIAKATEKAGPGDVVVIRGGVYRERVSLKTSGTAQAPIRFEAAPGEQVVVTGADQLTGWQKADEARPIYSVHWPHQFITWNRSMTHPDDAYHRVIGRCEQVAVEGYLLRQVLDPQFADLHQRDLRLSQENRSRLGECYPQGPVPGVALGVRD